MKKIVVFSGAGMSADSGIATFRDSDGLWANYRIEDVCTPEALLYNRRQVIDFYNMRRKELLSKTPNAGHRAIVELAKTFDVEVVTQNIDDLHERAAAEAGIDLPIVHLHGELRKLRSSINKNAIQSIEGWEQKIDEHHADGSLLRPFVVFFGEDVPMFSKAAQVVETADVLIVVGTSLSVYPAAGLVNYVRLGVPVYLVDPGAPDLNAVRNKVTHTKLKSAVGLPQLVDELTTNRAR